MSKKQKLGRDPLDWIKNTGQIDVNISTSKHVNMFTHKQVYKRRTFYLRPDQIKVLKKFAFEHEINISEVVRQALDSFLE